MQGPAVPNPPPDPDTKAERDALTEKYKLIWWKTWLRLVTLLFKLGFNLVGYGGAIVVELLIMQIIQSGLDETAKVYAVVKVIVDVLRVGIAGMTAIVAFVHGLATTIEQLRLDRESLKGDDR